MAGIDGPVAGKRGELAEGPGQGARVAAGEVGAAGGALEEGVSGEESAVTLEFPADAAGSVAGSLDDGPAGAGELEDGALQDREEGAGGCFGDVIEAGEVVLGAEAPGGVFRMDVDGRGEDGGEGGEGGEVVHMAVGQEIGDDCGAEFA